MTAIYSNNKGCTMKILVISNYYPPYYIGGYELACFDTVQYLKDCGHEVYVLTGNYKNESIEFETIYRKLKYINYENPSYFDKYKVEVYNYELTQELIKKIRPDLVYFWSLRLLSLSPALAVQKLQVKKVFEIGDLWMKGYFQNTIFSKLKRSIKNCLPFFVGSFVEFSPAICVSKWIEKEMKNKYLSKKTYVIPNGVKIYEKQKSHLSKKIRYMFCGRIDYSKGLDLALKALSNLKDRGFCNFELHIYGEGQEGYIHKCKKIINVLNLDKEVKFCGKKEDINKYYKDYDVLLMPTRMREPFGLVIIEAMAAGVVVIATNAYGPAEIITHKKDGLLFKNEDVNDLTKKILEVHNNPALFENLRNTAFLKVFEKFNLLSVKKEVENILIQTAKKDIL